LKSCRKRIGRPALKKRVHLLGAQVHVNKKHLTVIHFRKRGSEPGSKGGRSPFLRNARNANQLGFMRQMIELEIKTEAITNCVTVRPDEMARLPWRQLGVVRSNNERSRIRR